MIYILLIQLLLRLPDLVQPLVEGDILAYSLHKGHAGVCVHVDKAGERSLACTVHDFSTFRHNDLIIRWNDLGDQIALNEDI